MSPFRGTTSCTVAYFKRAILKRSGKRVFKRRSPHQTSCQNNTLEPSFTSKYTKDLKRSRPIKIDFEQPTGPGSLIIAVRHNIHIVLRAQTFSYGIYFLYRRKRSFIQRSCVNYVQYAFVYLCPRSPFGTGLSLDINSWGCQAKSFWPKRVFWSKISYLTK